jgi:peroxiredoxin Q/BCP
MSRMSSKPKVGSTAPDFTAPVVGGSYEAGATVTLSALRDKPVVLYFYPKDDTPGCTKQACEIRDGWAKLREQAHLFGVSVDSVKLHQKFIDKFSLPFPLISDEDKQIVDAYGVWVEKMLYGKKYMGTERSTIIIGTDGRIQAVLEKVKPEEHLEQVLASLK